MWLTLLWIVTTLLTVFSTISFSADASKIMALILIAISLLLTALRKRWLAYLFFLLVCALCLATWLVMLWR